MWVFLPVVLFFVEDYLARTTGRPGLASSHWATVANSGALPFAVLLVSFGVLIPNTWRRCAAGVALIGASGFVGDLLGFSFVPQPLAIAIPYLAQKTLWLTIACAVVVYGAYRTSKNFYATKPNGIVSSVSIVCERRLRASGMGEVYLAEHRLLRRTCDQAHSTGEGRGPGKSCAI